MYGNYFYFMKFFIGFGGKYVIWVFLCGFVWRDGGEVGK